MAGKTQQGRCKATWDEKNLPNQLDDVAAYGLGVPKVAEIHRGLTSLGFLNKDEPSPRSHQDLLRKLTTTPTCQC
jgi:hypothetical protein